MKNTKALLEKVSNVAYEVNNDKIKQTDRNNLKKDFLEAIFTDLEGAGFTVNRTNDGVILTVPSKKDDIFIAIDGVIKNLDFDLEGEIAEYELKVEKQAERERERIAKREKNSKK